MGGRRRDFDGQFAMIEVGFWLTDPRILKLSASAKTFYLYAWIIAIKERRETLPSWFNTRSLSDASHICPKSGRKAFLTLRENSLLGETADGRIIVCGAKRKHPNLLWKDDTINEVMPLHTEAQTETVIETETETETEGQNARVKTRAPSPVEFAFYEGFKNIYGSEHRQLNKGQAVQLAKLVSQFGEVAVKRKIDDWWTFPVKFHGQRSIQRFLWAYDDIEHYQSTAELMQQSEAEYGQRQRQNNQHCN